MEEASNRSDVKHLFTRGRHEDVSVIFLVQNLYHKAKHSREISLNTDYLVVFKNPRDLTPIVNIGRQMNCRKHTKTQRLSHLATYSLIYELVLEKYYNSEAVYSMNFQSAMFRKPINIAPMLRTV